MTAPTTTPAVYLRDVLTVELPEATALAVNLTPTATDALVIRATGSEDENVSHVDAVVKALRGFDVTFPAARWDPVAMLYAALAFVGSTFVVVYATLDREPWPLDAEAGR